MRSVRTVVRTLSAGFLALIGPVLAAPALQAHAQAGQQQSSRTVSASSHQLTVSIDAVNPSFATPKSTITVSGTITNHTGSPLRGVQVQLLTAQQFFRTRPDMDRYTAGTTPAYIFPDVAGAASVLKGTLHSGATTRWTASFPADSISYPQFGVYPLEALAEYPEGAASGTDRTFLPFWPGAGSAVPLNTAWVWPLIDVPQQGPCQQTLATDTLAASLGTGGRLGTLLAAGQEWARRDKLTWAVDPALLSDANVMTHAYKVDANATCIGTQKKPASAAAASWLRRLRGETADEPVFVTPYADIDVSALTHSAMYQILRTAYDLGESQARRILSRPFGTTGKGPGDGGSPAIAWPADGQADASVVTSLTVNGDISAVLLNSDEMRSTDAPYDNGIAATSTTTGKRIGVLLADSELTGIIASAPAGSPASAQFDAEQDFLAQTAMIVAEVPFYKPARSLVIAPPRRWDPSAAEAARMLQKTYSAPWLRKVTLSSLASAADRLKGRQPLPASRVRRTELSDAYLDRAGQVDSSLAVYLDLLYQPGADLPRRLQAASLATKSSAWRGAGVFGGRLALVKLADYLSLREQDVQIVPGTKLLLGGTSGSAPVSVQNSGDLAVQVRVLVSVPQNSQLQVDRFDSLLMVAPRTTGTVRMTVHSSAIGTTLMQLQLVTKNRLPLTWHGASQSMSVQSTRYGRALLVLIGAALGVLVLTSVARWIRRWLNDGRADGAGGTG